MRNVKNTFLATFLVLLALACKEKPSEDEKGVAEIADHQENFYGLEKEKFDTIIDGKEVKLYWIKNDNILVGMASSFRWYNDEKELCEIINTTIKENIKIQFLLIIGDKRRVKPIKNLISKRKLEKN